MTKRPTPFPGVFPPGPWDDEPDVLTWIDEATGYPCAAWRHECLGTLCGYVGVPENHPAAGAPYQALCNTITAHGGLTFADEWADPKGEFASFTNLWVLGFDCMHASDLVPFFLSLGLQPYKHAKYRDLPYVRAQCQSMAAQLAALAIDSSALVAAVERVRLAAMAEPDEGDAP
ncbi:MAG TPA: hypothetical protein VHQ92_11060 [Pseudolabrys sp.]|nr:hypothetical protein [Pseudolabrys sp.]